MAYYPGTDIIDDRTPREVAEAIFNMLFHALDARCEKNFAADVAGKAARAVLKELRRAEVDD